MNPANASSAPTLTEGSIVADKYLIEGMVGEGGMGVVFQAIHLELEHRVAIKVVRDELLTRDDVVVRMLREAKIAARLRSEHVTRVLDVGRLEGATPGSVGAPYIVMEFLEGADLERELASRGSLPVHEAIGIVLEVCDAVAEAHAAGIVHRDLKPENLFLARRTDGSSIVKVLDFGISQDAEPRVGRVLTGPNVVIGSPDYMSPEQVEGRSPIGPTADIWALGAVLYELVTGERPFESTSVAGIFARVLSMPPTPPRSIVHAVPRGLEAVILRCLQKNPSARYASIGDLAHALAPFGAKGSVEVAERVRRVTLNTRSPFLAPEREDRPSSTDLASRRSPLPFARTVGAPRAPRTAWAAGALGLLLAAGVFVAVGLDHVPTARGAPAKGMADSHAVHRAAHAPPPAAQAPPPAAQAPTSQAPPADSSARSTDPPPVVPTLAARTTVARATESARPLPSATPAPADAPTLPDAWDTSAFGGRK